MNVIGYIGWYFALGDILHWVIFYIGWYFWYFGWISALTEAEIASSGTADSFLKVFSSHTNQTCPPNYPFDSTETSEETVRGIRIRNSMEKWNGSEKSYIYVLGSHFEVWDSYISFCSSSEKQEFSLYVEVLGDHTTFFALNHVNYSRWVPVHIKDIKSLPSSIRNEFQIQNTGFYLKLFCNSNWSGSRAGKCICKRCWWFHRTYRKPHCIQAMDAIRSRTGQNPKTIWGWILFW